MPVLKSYRLVLLGPPASGKGTQGQWLVDTYQLPITSVGEMLRREQRAGSAVGREAASYTDHGRLVPDALAVKTLESWLETQPGDSFVLDGFPRTLGQAEMLNQLLAKRGTPLTAVLWLEVAPEVITDRVNRRVVCSVCERTYQVGWQVPSKTGVCPACHGALKIRHDDDPATLLQRLKQYEEHTRPLINFYEHAGILRRIDASQEPNQVAAQIVAATGLEQTASAMPYAVPALQEIP